MNHFLDKFGINDRIFLDGKSERRHCQYNFLYCLDRKICFMIVCRLLNLDEIPSGCFGIQLLQDSFLLWMKVIQNKEIKTLLSKIFWNFSGFYPKTVDLCARSNDVLAL